MPPHEGAGILDLREKQVRANTIRAASDVVGGNTNAVATAEVRRRSELPQATSWHEM